jgi:hypothetical protein
VTSVPPTRIRRNEAVVLAVKITGTQTVKVAGGEVTLPHVSTWVFINAHKGALNSTINGNRPRLALDLQEGRKNVESSGESRLN